MLSNSFCVYFLSGRTLSPEGTFRIQSFRSIVVNTRRRCEKKVLKLIIVWLKMFSFFSNSDERLWPKSKKGLILLRGNFSKKIKTYKRITIMRSNISPLLRVWEKSVRVNGRSYERTCRYLSMTKSKTLSRMMKLFSSLTVNELLGWKIIFEAEQNYFSHDCVARERFGRFENIVKLSRINFETFQLTISSSDLLASNPERNELFKHFCQ